MKVLRFGTSQDFVDVAPEFSYENQLRKALEAELGEPFEVVTKRAWPTERLPGLLRQWMEEEQPDVVMMNAISFWFMYPSVPLKLKRKYGRTGVKLGDAGLGMANIPWLAHNPVFHAGRKLATRLIGGETHFTADQVVDVLSACVKEAIRQEGVVVYVAGPAGIAAYADHTRRAMDEMETRRQYVTERLAAMCAQYRVSFRRYERPTYETGEAPIAGRDRLHTGAEGNAVLVGFHVQAVAEAIRAARGVGTATGR
jgi:hypothetical protein